jgi:DNA-binding YbaB/EbfC family protein
MGMANLQRMAQQMQQDMARVQSELEAAQVDGSAGGGVVSATVTGKGELVSITIDPSAVDPADVEMLQDLVVAAVNEGIRKAEELQQSKLGAPGGAEGFDPMSMLDSLGMGGLGGLGGPGAPGGGLPGGAPNRAARRQQKKK